MSTKNETIKKLSLRKTTIKNIAAVRTGIKAGGCTCQTGNHASGATAGNSGLRMQ